jgi:hypothetical protein
MNRSIFSTIVRALITWVTLVTWLLPSVVWAGTPYTIHWWLSEENPACETATIIYDGHPFFSVNGTPVPTFEVPGARQMFFGGPDTNQFDAGFNSVLLPDDPANYALGDWQIPGVAVPDVGSVPGAFDPGSDPYAAYADAVIAELAKHVSGKEIVERREFAIAVRAWRSNGAAIEQALAMRSGVSQAETSAFLNAENRVVAYVRQFMDAQDWFTDSPVPADLRATVDGSLHHAFGPLDDELKDSLNGWQGETLNLEQTQAYQTILAFGAAIEAIGDGFAAYAQVMQTLVTATSRIAVGFIPYVGPALDLCECITGKSWCLPSGKDLSNEERVFSGVGFAVGAVVPAFGGIKNAGVSPAAKVVAEDVVQLGEELAVALRANRRTWYKTLRGAVASQKINDFERKAALYLLKDEKRALIGVGDDGVRRVLGIPKQSTIEGVTQAPDFLSVTKGNKLALSEAKGVVSSDGEINAKTAINQLTNAMRKMKEIGMDGDVARVEIVIPKGVPFQDPTYSVNIPEGYLLKMENGVTSAVEVEGFKNVFVRVIQL